MGLLKIKGMYVLTSIMLLFKLERFSRRVFVNKYLNRVEADLASKELVRAESSSEEW